LVFCVPFLTGCAGCGTDDSGPPNPTQDGGIVWPDYGNVPNYDTGYNPIYDTGNWPTYDGPASTDTSVDSAATCPGPTGAACNPPCDPDQICTEANGGTCAKMHILTGQASSKEVLLEVAIAHAECWLKQPTSPTMCATFDACQLTGTITQDIFRNWVCDQSQISDFPSSGHYEAVHDSVCGCGLINMMRLEWQTAIGAGKQGLFCISYNPDWSLFVYDYVVGHDCSVFPPS
jgi:hypothetical protein